MLKGQWIKIVKMYGEPQMTGKVGQFQMADDIGQLHGTWGIAIQPDKDEYELITEEEAMAIKEGRQCKRGA